MGVATHWREAKVEPIVKRVEVIYEDNRLSIFPWSKGSYHEGDNNATATLNGKTWTIELD